MNTYVSLDGRQYLPTLNALILLFSAPASPSLMNWYCAYWSKANIRFQSFFMLITIHPCVLASSYMAWLKVPIVVSGSPCAGPYAYSRVASSCITTTDNLAPAPAFVYSRICWSSAEELPNAAFGRRPYINQKFSIFPAPRLSSTSFGSLVRVGCPSFPLPYSNACDVPATCSGGIPY